MKKIKREGNEPRLVLHGGWEFTKDDGVDKTIAKLANGKILFIPNASRFPDKQIDRAVKKYRELKTEIILLNKNATVLPRDIKVVYLGGGQPAKLIEYFKHHPELLTDIKERWRRQKIVWCGCSAGAIVVMPKMLAPNSYGRGEVDLEAGLGLIKKNGLIIPHWNATDTEEIWRRKVEKVHREKLLITIDEYTALFWHKDGARVIGLGAVEIIQHGQRQIYKNGQTINNLEISY